MFAIPAGIRAAESAWGLPTFSFPGQTVAAAAVFVAMGALNLASGYTMAVLGRGTPFPADMARALVVRGPYRFVRNPMALGGLGAGLGVALYLGSFVASAFVVAGGVLWNSAVRPREEADLAERFEDDYRRYRAEVRCWIPRTRPYRSTEASRPTT